VPVFMGEHEAQKNGACQDREVNFIVAFYFLPPTPHPPPAMEANFSGVFC
jgi:hypothetical protein